MIRKAWTAARWRELRERAEKAEAELAALRASRPAPGSAEDREARTTDAEPRYQILEDGDFKWIDRLREEKKK